jgi:hypothetical protein
VIARPERIGQQPGQQPHRQPRQPHQQPTAGPVLQGEVVNQRIPGINTMAVAALVFSVLLPPVGVVMGHVAKRQIRRTQESGATIASVALLVGYTITLCLCCIPVAVIVGLPLGL